MHLNNPTADIHIPDGASIEEALRRTTCLGIGAHQDDLEVFAFHGIQNCYDNQDAWFAGVTITSGSGSSRTGPYSKYTDEQMRDARRQEQRTAADLGQYSIQLQLDYSSAAIKDNESKRVVDDIERVLRATRPDTIYLHNPADKHDTHVAALARCIEALRRLPKDERPERALGCEVWRDLDWLPDDEKVCLDVSGQEELARTLLKVFDSQISGGKRYDLATLGRRKANATFYESHAEDHAESVILAIDLSPLVESDQLSLETFVQEKLQMLQEDISKRIAKYCI